MDIEQINKNRIKAGLPLLSSFSQPTVQSVSFDNDERIKKLKESMLARAEQQSNNISSVQTKKPSLLKNIGSALISAEKGLGETFGMASAVSGYGKTGQAIKQAQKSQLGLDKTNQQLGSKIIELKKQGKDTSKLENLWKENTGQIFNLSNITGGVVDKTAKQIFGEVAGVGLDIATAGTYGAAAKTAKAWQLLTKSEKLANIAGKIGVKSSRPLLTKTPVPSVLKQVGTGAGIGYGYDVATGLQYGENIPEALKHGAGMLLGGVAPLAIKGIGKGVGKVAQMTPELARTRLAHNLNNIFEKAPASIRKHYLAMKNKGVNVGKVLTNLGETADNFYVDNERLKFGTGIFNKVEDNITYNSKLLDEIVQLYPDAFVSREEAKKLFNKTIRNSKEIRTKGTTPQVEKKGHKIIDEYFNQKGRDILYLPEIHNYKKGAWSATKKFGDAGKINSADAYSEIGTTFRKIIEDAIPDVKVKEINAEIGQLEELYKFLNKIDSLQDGGIVLKGGKLGKYVGNVGGYIGGMAVGGLFGGVPGIVLGGLVGKNISSVLRKLSQKSSILKPLDRLLIRFAEEVPPSVNVKAAQDFLEAVKLGTKKPAITPRVIKGFEEMKSWVQKKYGGETSMLPEGKQGLTGGTINLPEVAETSRQKAVQASGVLPARPPKVLPQVARPGQKMLSEAQARNYLPGQTSAKPIVTRPPTFIEPQAGKTIKYQSKAIPKELEKEAKILRGTKGMTAEDIMKKYPNIKLKRDVPAKDIYGNKVEIPEGEKLTPYELKGNKILLQDGQPYIVSKNQFANIKGNAIVAEGKPFAPELKGLEESVKGTKISLTGEEQRRLNELSNISELQRTPEQQSEFMQLLKRDNEAFDTGKDTKFSQYTLPGGKDYIEVIHKDPRFPVKPDESHFGDAASWHRANERTYKGKKVYFVEEIQKGKYLDETPNHPLAKGKYVKVEIQSSLNDAVDNNADYFAWINGEQTSARYDLATYLDNASWKTGDGVKDINLITKDKGLDLKIKVDTDNGVIIQGSEDWQGKKLDEVLGKGLADKIMSKESGTLSGEGLKFGGEWATNLYDKQVKNIVEKLTGQKVEMLDMGLPISKDVKRWYKAGLGTVEEMNIPLKLNQIKVGMKITEGGNASDYIITDVLGDGKFKAVKKSLKLDRDVATQWEMQNSVRFGDELYNKADQETFDISEKLTKQQGIKLTPEVKAKIRGEAPKIKTSGKMFGKIYKPSKTAH